MEELLNHIHCMDCLEFLKLLPDNSIDSCVTDPPYGLEFMGKEWDNLKNMQEWHYQWAILVFQKLKPGAHILAFSGTRTYHRLACAIEDAGFEIRDQVHWLYGSGFPKGQNIAKTIDKKLGLDGTPVPKELLPKRNQREAHTDFRSGRFHRADGDHETMEHTTTLPESEEAKEWTGWNTQLKPAHEPIVLARKPISEKSIVENVLMHGTGGLNIDGCRIAVDPEVDDMMRKTDRGVRQAEAWKEGSGFKNEAIDYTGVPLSGRYPANLILSHHPDCKLIQEGETTVKDVSTHAPMQKLGKHGIYGHYDVPVNIRHSFDVVESEIWECVEDCPVRMLNEQTADLKSGGSLTGNEPSCKTGTHGIYGPIDRRHVWKSYGDSSGAARFFYCAKPSKSERDAGLNGRNIHITVKPLEIIRWLVRLVTSRGGIVLDPFLGSGTTAIAAENEGCDWLGCDISEEYCEIARLRIEALGGTQTVLDDFDMSLNHEEEVEVGE